MSFATRLLETFRHSPLRRLFRPVEALIKPYFLGRSQILLGPLKGAYFPAGERGILVGSYEPEVQKALEDNLRMGEVFYDVGAHRGYFSLLASKLVGTTGQVVAFEPLPDNAKIFDDVMSRNHIEHCTLQRVAVSSAPGKATLFTSEENSYRASLLPWKGKGELAVNLVTLDDVVKGHRAPNLIKMDVEGAEDQVLQGATELLSQPNPPAWVIEAHSQEKDDFVRAFLGERGYQIEVLLLQPDKPYPRNLIATHATAASASAQAETKD